MYNYKDISILCTIFSLFLIFTFTTESRSQVVQTSGSATEASSQLIYYYDTEFAEGEMFIQVTNTSDVEDVTIHVQIFRNDDPDNDDATPNVICDERNFVDELTPNDTHIYDLKQPGFVKNAGETEADAGESTAIDVDRTKGFVVITPVVSSSDLTAISFQNLMGLTIYEQGFEDLSFLLNAMGRDAVDFTTGQVVADGTPLDGVTNGFVVLQPAEMDFDFMGYLDGGPARVDVVGFVFEDVYGEAGLLGYQVQPGDSTWTSFIFDFKEDPTSCGNKAINCFATFGLNDNFAQNNTDFVEDLLCAGTETPPYPQENFGVTHFGWTRIFVSGLEGLENQVALFTNGNASALNHMGGRTQLDPSIFNEVMIINGDNSFGGGWMYTN